MNSYDRSYFENWQYSTFDNILIVSGIDVQKKIQESEINEIIREKAYYNFNVNYGGAKDTVETRNKFEQEQRVTASNEMKKTFENRRKIYDQYSEALNTNINYSTFLTNVDAHRFTLASDDTNFAERHAVATKLSSLAEERIKVQESNFSILYKLFHKIFQIFQGHGFRTEGEWGIEFANRIEKINLELVKEALRQSIRDTKNDDKEALSKLKLGLDSITDAQFGEVLIELMLSEPSLRKQAYKKFAFYEMLSPEKKDIINLY